MKGLRLLLILLVWLGLGVVMNWVVGLGPHCGNGDTPGVQVHAEETAPGH